nr:hypothetical protein GCM10020063_018620 [Dactylosporangium thailandense]
MTDDLLDRADRLAEAGRVDEAVAELRAVLGERAASSWPLGELLERHGRPGEALEVYRASVAAGETHVRARLARLLLDQGRVDEAIHETRTAIADGELRAYGALGFILARTNRQAEAHDEATRLARAGKWLACARLIAGLKRGDAAAEH